MSDFPPKPVDTIGKFVSLNCNRLCTNNFIRLEQRWLQDP